MSYDADTGKMVSNWVLTDVYKNNKQLLDDVTIMFTTLALKIGTFVVIIAATALTVFKLKQAIAWRQNTSRDDRANRAQTSLAKMLVVISCVYIACAVPSVVTAIVRYLVDEFQPWGRYSYTALCTLMLAQVFTSVNSAVNFFVYFFKVIKVQGHSKKNHPCSKTREPKALKKSTFSDQTQLSSE
nr:hypothetical protein BaRGS_032814 [Batillaria attramentaria]